MPYNLIFGNKFRSNSAHFWKTIETTCGKWKTIETITHLFTAHLEYFTPLAQMVNRLLYNSFEPLL